MTSACAADSAVRAVTHRLTWAAAAVARVGWRCPALAFFVVFGLIPLVGVLLLSFTTWDGIGTSTRPV